LASFPCFQQMTPQSSQVAPDLGGSHRRKSNAAKLLKDLPPTTRSSFENPCGWATNTTYSLLQHKQLTPEILMKMDISYMPRGEARMSPSNHGAIIAFGQMS